MSIIIFIVILLVLVVSHEFGHFIVAKKSGIRVDEFSFGFPPKIYGKKIGETTYNLNALPFGGYVKIFGENGDENTLSIEDQKRSFVHKPKYIQALVLVAGVVMNLLVAWFLITIGLTFGLPSSVSSAPTNSYIENEYLTVTSVLKDSPAEISGIETGDKLIRLENNTTSISELTPDSLKSFIVNNGNESITVEYIRGSTTNQLEVKPQINDNNIPSIGIAMDMIGTLKLPVHKAVIEGFKLTLNLTTATVKGFYKLITEAFTGKGDISSITGPVGIVGVVGDAASFGFIYLLSFTALISVNLAVINLMPFPALDGGRLLFLLIEKIKGSKIKTEVANIINIIGFSLLILLMVFITYYDIIKLV